MARIARWSIAHRWIVVADWALLAVVGGGGDPTAFAFNYALTYLTTMSTLVQNIVAPVGLGVAIDYALLIVTRWREERGNGQDNQAEVLRTAATAGSSVLFSGRTVAVSLAALALATVPFLRSIGLAGLLIPPINIAVSATLLPDPRPAGAALMSNVCRRSV